MGLETIAYLAMAAAGVYAATNQPKPPKPKTAGAPPTPVEPGELQAKKRRQYRPPAQLFRDEDLRLGAMGKLGL